MKDMKAQLRAWAAGNRVVSEVKTDDQLGADGLTLVVTPPRDAADARWRLAEVEASLVSMTEQLESRDSSDFSSRSAYESWRHRCSAAIVYTKQRQAALTRYLELETPAAEMAEIQRERDLAVAACQRIGAELADARARESSVDRAVVALEFVEVARLALAESTFQRLMERARDRSAPKSQR